MPVEVLKKLPKKASNIWESVYRNARSKNMPIERAAQVAWGAVKRVYKKKKGVWVRKHSKLKLHLIKHGWMFPSYKFELELSNNKWDTENERVSEELLQKLVEDGNISEVGDVDHERYYKTHNAMEEREMINPDKGTEGLYFLDGYKYENGAVKAVVVMNKKHHLFEKYLNLHKQGKFLYASAEFPDATLVNGEIVEADKMLWSITDCPAAAVSRGKFIAG